MEQIEGNVSQQDLVRNHGNGVEFSPPPSGEISPSRSSLVRRVSPRQGVSVAILCFVNLINYMDRFTIAGILDDIQGHFDVTNGEAGLLQTVFIISYMVFAPLFGYLGDRYSRKWIMAFGVFLWSLTTLLGSFMQSFAGFIAMRALVGIGEASYSTIAPTLISDMFTKDLRSVMLGVFYFAIPIGSGLGYIVGSKAAEAAGAWQWALRVTPVLGVLAVLLIATVLVDPPRGASDGSQHIRATSWSQDLRALMANTSFVLGTLGFTCVAFVAGALAWWGPKFVTYGLKLQRGAENASMNDVSFVFGVIAMLAGLVGVSVGVVAATRLRARWPRADPLVCAVGLLVSAPLMFVGAVVTRYSVTGAYVLFFFAQVFLNLNWSIVADMLLYVVVPTRRSTAEALQILVSHLLGDAGSPYLIGMVSDCLLVYLGGGVGGTGGTTAALTQSANSTDPLYAPMVAGADAAADLSPPGAAYSAVAAGGDPDRGADSSSTALLIQFQSLQYALFITVFVEVIGGLLFLINSVYIVRDRERARRLTTGSSPVIAIERSSCFADDSVRFRDQSRSLLT